jgi:hypothetical protein
MKMRRIEHIVCTGEMQNAHRILEVQYEGYGIRLRREDNIKCSEVFSADQPCELQLVSNVS